MRRLQELLTEAGEAVAATGVFGPKTHAAVVAFQRARAELHPATGGVGRGTWAALDGGGLAAAATTADLSGIVDSAKRVAKGTAEFVLHGLSGVDLVVIALSKARPFAIDESAKVTTAGNDYGPRNALRHCLFAASLYSYALRAAAAEVLFGGVSGVGPVMGVLVKQRVRLMLSSHEWFGDDGCGNTGTGTADSEADRFNNEVGLAIAGFTVSDAALVGASTAALDDGRLRMTPGPAELDRLVSTAGWRGSPWLAGGRPRQADCSHVTAK